MTLKVHQWPPYDGLCSTPDGGFVPSRHCSPTCHPPTQPSPCRRLEDGEKVSKILAPLSPRLVASGDRRHHALCSTGTKMLESRAWCPLALGAQWGPASQATASGMTITMVTTNRALPRSGQGAELFLWFCHRAKPYVMGSITTSSSQMRS